MGLFGIDWGGKEKKRRQDAETALQQKRTRQIEAGEALFEAMVRAAQENKLANSIKDNGKETPAKGVELITVWKKEDNGGKYSAFAEMKNTVSNTGPYPIFQIFVDMNNTGKEIHLFSGPYGKEINTDLPITDLERAKSITSEYIKRYRLYPPR